jgi:hypothetical protein
MIVLSKLLSFLKYQKQKNIYEICFIFNKQQ